MGTIDRGEPGPAEQQLDAALTECTDDLIGLADALETYAGTVGENAPEALKNAPRLIREIHTAQTEGRPREAAYKAALELNHASSAVLCLDYLDRQGNVFVEDFEQVAHAGSPEAGHDINRAQWFRERVLPRLQEIREARVDQMTKIGFTVSPDYEADLTDDEMIEKASQATALRRLQRLGFTRLKIDEWDNGDEQGLTIVAEIPLGRGIMASFALDDDGSQNLWALTAPPDREIIESVPVSTVHPDIWKALRAIATGEDQPT